MSTTDTRRSVWVAFGAQGVVGSIRKDDDGYTVTMAGAESALASYPSMEIAKSALYSRMSPGTDWPRFEEH